mmetsp:Transcript_105426/g.297908  ORF Transcript_105426/g.297908 Transcript_105426/m.297908 type:complete len:211 (+) Transcript_105426:180-812(+)
MPDAVVAIIGSAGTARHIVHPPHPICLRRTITLDVRAVALQLVGAVGPLWKLVPELRQGLAVVHLAQLVVPLRLGHGPLRLDSARAQPAACDQGAGRLPKGALQRRLGSHRAIARRARRRAGDTPGGSSGCRCRCRCCQRSLCGGHADALHALRRQTLWPRGGDSPGPSSACPITVWQRRKTSRKCTRPTRPDYASGPRTCTSHACHRVS